MGKESKTDDEIVEIKSQEHAAGIIKQAVGFLEIFMPKTLAKRFVAIILLAIGVPVKTAISLAGLSEKSLWTLHKQLSESDVSEIMVFHYGGGHRAKASGLEGQILAEIETNILHAENIYSNLHGILIVTQEGKCVFSDRDKIMKQRYTFAN